VHLHPDQSRRRTEVHAVVALVAYKINWQSVLFAGYGDTRELSDRHQIEPSSRQFFVKVSYAVQR